MAWSFLYLAFGHVLEPSRLERRDNTDLVIEVLALRAPRSCSGLPLREGVISEPIVSAVQRYCSRDSRRGSDGSELELSGRVAPHTSSRNSGSTPPGIGRPVGSGRGPWSSTHPDESTCDRGTDLSGKPSTSTKPQVATR